MKLLLCRSCGNIKELGLVRTICACGKAMGYYENDGINAKVSGMGELIGIANPDIDEALNRPDHNMPYAIRCWLIGDNSPHVERI